MAQERDSPGGGGRLPSSAWTDEGNGRRRGAAHWHHATAFRPRGELLSETAVISGAAGRGDAARQ